MLSEALRLMRVFHDLKQQELAEKLGMSKSYLSELESGKKTPSMEVVQRYSELFDIPASSILFFSENLSEPGKATRMRSAIAGKVLQFLRFVEAKTTHDHG